MSSQIQILKSLQESLDSFVSHLSLRKSPPTVQAYQSDVINFLRHLQDKKVKRLSSITPKHIEDYLGYCKGQGKSDASVNRYYMSIRAYCRFLRKNKIIAEDLTQDITAPKNKPKAPRVPTIAEIKRILDQPNPETESGTRDRAILQLLYSSGLRASELCDLQLEDITPKSVRVSCGKRSKTRTVPVSKKAYESIEDYLLRYRGFDRGYLFLTKMSKKLRIQLLGSIVSEYAQKAGVNGVTTHTLRHACATHLLERGADIRMIQNVLGHSSIVSTQIYTHLSSNSIDDMFRQYHPSEE